MRPSCGHFYKLHSSEVGIWIIVTNGSLPPGLDPGGGSASKLHRLVGEVKRFMLCASHGLSGLDFGLRRNDHKAR